MTVVADSPQFSALVSQNAIPEYRATAITVVNSIGFLITIPSLYFMQWAYSHLSERNSFALLALGGLFGLVSIWRAVWKK